MIRQLWKKMTSVEENHTDAQLLHDAADLSALSELMIPLPGLYGISSGFIDPYWWYDEKA